MDTSKLDLVYFVKEGRENEELKYSLRSVCENLPHRKVWFVGGCPDGLEPDGVIKTVQHEATKWKNTNLAMKAACSDERITDNFVLMNDDFFVMSFIKTLPRYYDGSLTTRINQLITAYGDRSDYRRNLVDCRNQLKRYKLGINNYAVHVPMIVNKDGMIKTMALFDDGLMWRSLYGNYIEGGVERQIKDGKVKLTLLSDEPSGNEVFLSTNDRSFQYGAVGKYIRERFNYPCKYEK